MKRDQLDFAELARLLVETGRTPTLASRLFTRAADQITCDWIKRSKSDGLPPAETATGYLKRSAYTLIRAYLDAGCGRIIIDQVRREGRIPKRGPAFDVNPFHWGLLAIFADDSIVNKDERRLFANQFLYAYRHDVPEHFLIGFLYQLGKTQHVFEYVWPAAGLVDTEIRCFHLSESGNAKKEVQPRVQD